MKPDWNDAPKWAKWLAMDADGAWYWFQERPHLRNVHVVEWENHLGGKAVMAAAKNDEWRESLESRP